MDRKKGGIIDVSSDSLGYVALLIRYHRSLRLSSCLWIVEAKLNKKYSMPHIAGLRGERWMDEGMTYDCIVWEVDSGKEHQDSSSTTDRGQHLQHSTIIILYH